MGKSNNIDPVITIDANLARVEKASCLTIYIHFLDCS